jgi:hypothetical protein
MNAARIVYHMAKADLLERVRRYSYLITLALTLYLSYSIYTGFLGYRLEEYRGVYNSAWLGCEMTLVITAFLSLIGFYVVKNSIQRDRETRVGRILAATPMSRALYIAAKSVSNFAVMASMVLVLCGAAVAMQLARSESAHLEPALLLAPILAFGLTALAVTAALAVLFETLPVLRGGVGNVIWFFLWTALIAMGAGTTDHARPITRWQHYVDFSGIVSITSQIQQVLRVVDPGYKGGAVLGGGGLHTATKTFLFTGLDWTADVILSRVFWLGIAAAAALLASLFFDRFDPAREWHAATKKKSATAAPSNGETALASATTQAPAHAHLTPLRRSAPATRFPHLVAAELRLMLKGRRWWLAVAAALLFAEMVSPLESARGGVLVAAWLWPILLWSQMGCRELRNATSALLFSAPGALQRQLPALWTAGFLLTLATGGGVGIRLLLTGDIPAFGAWVVGAAFIPSLALACGAWSGSSKLFEALYTVWWYIGPADHAPWFNFANLSAVPGHVTLYGVLIAVLIAAALAGRRAKLAYA